MLFEINTVIWPTVLVGLVATAILFWNKKIGSLTVGVGIKTIFEAVICFSLFAFNIMCLFRAISTFKRVCRLVRRWTITPTKPKKPANKAEDRLSSLREAPFSTICDFLTPFEVLCLSETNRTCYRKATKDRIWKEKNRKLEIVLNKQGKGDSLLHKFLDLAKELRILEEMSQEMRDIHNGMLSVLVEELVETLKLVLVPLKLIGAVLYPFQSRLERLIRCLVSKHPLKRTLEVYLVSSENALTWESAHRNISAFLANTLIIGLASISAILAFSLQLVFLKGTDRAEEMRRTSFSFSLNSFLYLFFNLTFTFWFPLLLKYLIFSLFVPEFALKQTSFSLETLINLQNLVLSSVFKHPLRFSVAFILSTYSKVAVGLTVAVATGISETIFCYNRLTEMALEAILDHFFIIPSFYIGVPIIFNNRTFRSKTLKRIFFVGIILQFAIKIYLSSIGFFNLGSVLIYCAYRRRSLIN